MKDKTTEVSFYKLTTLPVEKASLKLMEKIYYSKQKLVVIAENEKQMKAIDDFLWSYSTKHFIAHGTCNDSFQEDQPIFLSHKLENPNKASIAMALGEVEVDSLLTDKIIYIFDGNNQKQVDFARIKWKSYKDRANHNVIYWQQNLQGAWEKMN